MLICIRFSSYSRLSVASFEPKLGQNDKAVPQNAQAACHADKTVSLTYGCSQNDCNCLLPTPVQLIDTQHSSVMHNNKKHSLVGVLTAS